MFGGTPQIGPHLVRPAPTPRQVEPCSAPSPTAERWPPRFWAYLKNENLESPRHPPAPGSDTPQRPAAPRAVDRRDVCAIAAGSGPDPSRRYGAARLGDASPATPRPPAACAWPRPPAALGRAIDLLA